MLGVSCFGWGFNDFDITALYQVSHGMVGQIVARLPDGAGPVSGVIHVSDVFNGFHND